MYDRQKIAYCKKMVLSALSALLVLTIVVLLWAFSAFLPFYGYGQKLIEHSYFMNSALLAGYLEESPFHYHVHQPKLFLQGFLEITYCEAEDTTLQNPADGTTFHLKIQKRPFSGYKMLLTLTEIPVLGEERTTVMEIDQNGNFLPEKSDNAQYTALMEEKLQQHQKSLALLLGKAKDQWGLNGVEDLKDGFRYYYGIEGPISIQDCYVNIGSTLLFFLYHSFGVAALLWLYRVRVPYIRYTYGMHRYHGKTECNYAFRKDGFDYQLKTPSLFKTHNFLTVSVSTVQTDGIRLLIVPQKDGSYRFYVYKNPLQDYIKNVPKTELLFKGNTIVNRAEWILREREKVLALLENARLFWALPLPKYTFPISEERKKALYAENLDFWSPDFSIPEETPEKPEVTEISENPVPSENLTFRESPICRETNVKSPAVLTQSPSVEEKDSYVSMDSTVLSASTASEVSADSTASVETFKAVSPKETTLLRCKRKAEKLRAGLQKEVKKPRTLLVLCVLLILYNAYTTYWNITQFLPFYGYQVIAESYSQDEVGITPSQPYTVLLPQKGRYHGIIFGTQRNYNANLEMQLRVTRNPDRSLSYDLQCDTLHGSKGNSLSILLKQDGTPIWTYTSPDTLEAQQALYTAAKPEIDAFIEQTNRVFAVSEKALLLEGLANNARAVPVFFFIKLFFYLLMQFLPPLFLIWYFGYYLPFKKHYCAKFSKAKAAIDYHYSTIYYEENSTRNFVCGAKPPFFLASTGTLILYLQTNKEDVLKLVIHVKRKKGVCYVGLFERKQRLKEGVLIPLCIEKGVLTNPDPLVKAHKAEIEDLLRTANRLWAFPEGFLR